MTFHKNYQISLKNDESRNRAEIETIERKEQTEKHKHGKEKINIR